MIYMYGINIYIYIYIIYIYLRNIQGPGVLFSNIKLNGIIYKYSVLLFIKRESRLRVEYGSDKYLVLKIFQSECYSG